MLQGVFWFAGNFVQGQTGDVFQQLAFAPGSFNQLVNILLRQVQPLGLGLHLLNFLFAQPAVFQHFIELVAQVFALNAQLVGEGR